MLKEDGVFLVLESRCCCMLESMILPPYSKSDPNAEVVQHPTPQHAARMFKCVCGM